MHKIILLLTTLALAAGCNSKPTPAPERPALVSASWSDSLNQRITIVTEWDNSAIHDTLQSVEGNWSYRGKLDTARLVSFYVEGKRRPISLLLTPNSSISLTGRYDSLHYEGDSLNRPWMAFQEVIAPYQRQFDSLHTVAHDYMVRDTAVALFAMRNSRDYRRADSLWRKEVNQFVSHHRDNPVVLLAIQDYLRSTQNSDSLSLWTNRLAPNCRGFALEQQLSDLAKTRRNSTVGGRIPYLRFTNRNDQERSTGNESKEGSLILFLYAEEDAFTRAVFADLEALGKEKRKKQPKIWSVALGDTFDEWKIKSATDTLGIEHLCGKLGVSEPQLQQAGIVKLPTLLVIDEKHDLRGYDCYGEALRKAIAPSRAK